MHKKRRRLRKTVKKTIRILLITFIVVLTGLSYSLVTDADDYNSNDYPAYQNTISIDTQSYGKLSLSVTADEHILPENTNISLKEITDTASEEYKNILSALQDDANSNNDLLSGVLLYDLSFTDTDSHEIPSINDHDIHVYGSYENHADPLTENTNESVSVKLISKDNAYTVTDLSEDNYSAVDTDSNNAVENMSMTIHGSTYYALIWHKKPEITIHAVDENNTELLSSNTVQIAEDTYINDFTPSIDGYTLTSITGDNTDITKVKAENGKLYFHNGTEWKETSDNNVYFHYVSNKTQQPVEEESIEETTQPDTEETPVPEAVTDNTHQLTKTTDDNKYTVTVSYGDDAGLPEGTSLQVTTIDSDKEEYASAKKAVAASKQVDEDTLGMDALDITLIDSDGTKVEPSESSNIQISISINDLPDNIDSVEIHHITDEDKPETTEDKASAVAENVDVVNNTANAEFNVNSFSTFTITWTKGGDGSDKDTRIAQVKLHYVDEDGNDVGQPTQSLSADDLAKTDGGIITLSNYAAKGIANYAFKEARLADAKTGTVITGLMAKGTTDSNNSKKTNYSLKYTSNSPVPFSEDASWTDIPSDAMTGANLNSVDVYLVYSEEPTLTIHYVNEAGTELATSVTDYASGFTTAKTLSELVGDKNSITYTDGNNAQHTYTFESSARIGSLQGPSVSNVQAIIDQNTNKYILQYKTNESADWTNVELTNGNADLYLIYNRTDTDATKITIHYVDVAGNPIQVNGTDYTKVVYPDEWTSSDNIKNDTSGNGYVDLLAMYSESFDGYLDLNFRHVNENNSGTGLFYLNTNGNNTRGVVKGTNFRFMRYISSTKKLADGGGALRDGNVNANRRSTTLGNLDVYFFYMRPLRIHYVDENGNQLYDTFTTTNIVPYDTTGFKSATYDKNAADRNGSNATTVSNNSINLNSTAYYNNHGSPEHIYAYNPADSDHVDQAEISSIAWKWNTTAWQTQFNGTSTVDSLITDVYMVYPTSLSVTVHHIDANGNKIAEDTTATISSNETNSKSAEDFKSTSANVTNYTATSIKYGSKEADAFASIQFTKNGNNWQYQLDEGSAQDISGNVEVYVVYTEKTDNKTLVVHFVDEDGNQIAEPYVWTTFTISSDTSTGQNYGRGNGEWHGTDPYQQIGNVGNDRVPTGYTFYAEYLGPTFPGTTSANKSKRVETSLDTHYNLLWKFAKNETNESNNGWWTSYGPGPGDNPQNGGSYGSDGVFHEYITDIYWVYSKPTTATDLTIHYIHPKYTTVDGKEIGSTDSIGNPEYELFTGLSAEEHPVTISRNTVEKAGDDGIDLTTGDTNPNAAASTYAKDITDGSATYNYYGSFLASPISSSNQLPAYTRLTTDGPHVKRVRIHNNKYQFLVVSGDGLNRPLSQTRRDQWSYVTLGGRTYTLRKGSDGNFSMLDSQAGRSIYPLSLTSTENSTDASGNNVTINTYTGTSGTEGTGIVYTIREIVTTSGTATYDVTVHEWTDVNQHDIYQMYEKNTESPNVVISNEVVYSGNLVARTTNLENDKVISYEWLKSINDGPFETVVRKQTGSEWNIDHDLRSRSWLDLVADEGELSRKEKRTSVKYKVRVTFNTDENTTDTVESQEYSVPYWDQLENGSFENPNVKDTDKDNPASKQYSNADYKSEGVWQTTGLGTGGKLNDDIEIVNTQRTSAMDWKTTYGWPADSIEGGKDGAAEGFQFAELNCESAGALYQDVVTAPNEYLNYWLSHRARGTTSSSRNSSRNAVYDTMYLVIMPTKMAMTSASDGGELKNQDDLQNFIKDHAGSFASSNPGKLEDEPVYRDYDSGVLIVKISSNNHGWHNVSATNGYIATSNLTRFFFVAAYTSTGNPTSGNFLDNVGFSQELQTPETPHYHMVIKKTFNGLSANQIAELTDFKFTIDEYTRSGESGNYTYNQKNSTSDPSDYYEPDNTSNEKHTSLNDAQLGFTVDDNGNLELTATARDPNNPLKGDRVNLLNNGSTGVVSEDPSTGEVTLTWTLYNNYFPTVGTGATSEKYFTVTESGTDINGYSVATSNDGTIADVTSTTVDGVTTDTTTTTNLYEDSNGNATSSDGAKTTYFTIKDRSTARINYDNSYRDNSNDDPDQIRIQKTFTGITPTVVSNLNGTADPFKITVKNSNNSPITLVGNVTNPVSGSYPTGVESVDLETKANDDGSSTFTWTIIGTADDSTWIKGTSYSVKEENYTPTENNPVTKITLNGLDAYTTTDGKVAWTASDGNTEGFRTVTVGEDTDIPTINADDATKNNAVVTKNGDTLTPMDSLNENTNLIIAKYTLSSDSVTHYLVWTPYIVGVNEEAAIRKVITDKFTDSDIGSVSYRSGANPGDIEISANEPEGTAKGKMTYNSETHNLSFTDSGLAAGAKWQSYYSIAATMTNPERANEIRITNSYEPAIRVMKISSGDTPTPLQGAEFKLYKYDGSSKKYFGTDKQFNEDNSTNAVTLTTNSEGIGEGKVTGNKSLQIINGLQYGTYYLEETKAPDGYNMPSKNIIAFTIDDSGIVSQVTDRNALSGPTDEEKDKINISTTGNDAVTIDWNSAYYTVMVRNEPGVVLPITGGIGTYIFYIAGGLIVVAAILLLVKRRTNRE